MQRFILGMLKGRASALLLLAGGCTTLEGGHPTAFGPYGPERLDARTETARSSARLEQMESAVRRLQSQVDGLSESQHQVIAQADARVMQSRQEGQALRTELDTLKREVAALRAEQQQVRSAVDDLPARVSRAVAAARPPAPPPPKRGAGTAAVGYEHEVEPGQTLSEIARAYGVRMDAIVKENNLKDAGAIRVGQKLFIPRP